jgi:hypothetical protein
MLQAYNPRTKHLLKKWGRSEKAKLCAVFRGEPRKRSERLLIEIEKPLMFFPCCFILIRACPPGAF